MSVNRRFDVNANLDIGSVENLLLRLKEDFSRYYERLEQAHAGLQVLLARRRRGFSSSYKAALYEQTFNSAIQDYLQLLEQLMRVSRQLFLAGNIAAWTISDHEVAATFIWLP
jgi:hypothetical protein